MAAQTNILQFQSTLPRRERRRRLYNHAHYVQISIHAPAKGATEVINNFNVYNSGFQSTLPRRERPEAGMSVGYAKIFQSTLPRRERLYPADQGRSYRKFQSTLPRRERRCFVATVLCAERISIHAPAKGATSLMKQRQYGKAFQSTLPRRERPGKRCWSGCAGQFQSTLPRRERRTSRSCTASSGRFQSTLPRRERQHLLTSFRLQYGYSLFHLTNKI